MDKCEKRIHTLGIITGFSAAFFTNPLAVRAFGPDASTDLVKIFTHHFPSAISVSALMYVAFTTGLARNR